MNIVVFIKQVPDTTDVKWTQNNNIDRTNMESILNPTDGFAIEVALSLKDKLNAKTTVVTMGPNKAKDVLSYALAMGIDDAYLLSDAKFSGSDTCATSRVLASFIQKIMPDTNLILFGQTAIDGETGQTGISTATRLNIPFATKVVEITEQNDDSITVLSDFDSEFYKNKLSFPCALCIKNFAKPRLPKIDGYIKAQNYDYKVLSAQDLGLSPEETGIKGSPTYVSKVFKKEDKRDCKFMQEADIINAIKEAM